MDIKKRKRDEMGEERRREDERREGVRRKEK